MNVGRFILNVVIAFVAYFILYTLAGMVVFAEQFATLMPAMKPQDDPANYYIMVYHLIQTIVFVWLFGKAVGSNDMKAGATFGVMMGLYLAATDSIWFTGLKDIPTDSMVPLVISHLVIGAIIGTLLAKLYKAPEAA